MTYFNDVSHTPNKKHPEQSGGSSAASGKTYQPDDMGSDAALSMDVQRDHLSHLQNRFSVLSLEDPVDSYYKLSNAICSVRKVYAEAGRLAQTAQKEREACTSDPISDDEYDDDLRALCELFNALPDEVYTSPPAPFSTSAAALSTALGEVDLTPDKSGIFPEKKR